MDKGFYHLNMEAKKSKGWTELVQRWLPSHYRDRGVQESLHAIYWWRKSAYADNTILEGWGSCESADEVWMWMRLQNLQPAFRDFLSWSKGNKCNQSPAIRFAKGAILTIQEEMRFLGTWWKGSGNNFQARYPLIRAWPQLPNSQIFHVKMSRWSTLHEVAQNSLFVHSIEGSCEQDLWKKE